MNKSIELFCSDCNNYISGDSFCVRKDVLCLIDNVPLKLNPARERLGIDDSRPKLGDKYRPCTSEAIFFNPKKETQVITKDDVGSVEDVLGKI